MIRKLERLRPCGFKRASEWEEGEFCVRNTDLTRGQWPNDNDSDKDTDNDRGNDNDKDNDNDNFSELTLIWYCSRIVCWSVRIFWGVMGIGLPNLGIWVSFLCLFSIDELGSIWGPHFEWSLISQKKVKEGEIKISRLIYYYLRATRLCIPLCPSVGRLVGQILLYG